MRLGSRRWWMMASAALALWADPCPAQSQPAAGDSSLVVRMQAFVDSLRYMGVDSAAAYFPRSGDFTWVETSHYDDRDAVGIWRFPAAEFRAAYNGPLFEVLDIDHHGQRIGSLSHQIMIRRPEWRRVAGNRFVPADGPDSAPIYVQWRLEDGRWVISAIGDETFRSDKILPAWCC
jgi:hypothetical protein